MAEPYITTHSGQHFEYTHPERFEYSLGDIGHALGNLCHFVGQGEWFSVAQHSLLASELVGPRDRFRALLHDASEAFMGDCPGPLKHMPEMLGYREIERRIMAEIHRQFGIPKDAEAEKRVKAADLMACKAEAKMIGLKAPEYEPYPDIEVPPKIAQLNAYHSGKQFESMGYWLMEMR